ncbi:hypothetical protein HBI25_160430 [Parastagonospora nodorum]|nr:hypothetical protein HBI06_191570 [Parastagonospora nodorum]KAH4235496.1 hypothetical protein HBI05_149030 [Parastagonospora nodorum]KAH4255038.1 hypothetical protein HBI03_179430 [Parastagonospora nodorum]KAH4266790.1 hypothetical protein HBI04_174450 [Parastagonospora nodorum]KAH5303631.1 hypothetical protein HBI50_193440 [Parastagonospora nodorum]
MDQPHPGPALPSDAPHSSPSRPWTVGFGVLHFQPASFELISEDHARSLWMDRIANLASGCTQGCKRTSRSKSRLWHGVQICSALTRICFSKIES